MPACGCARSIKCCHAQTVTQLPRLIVHTYINVRPKSWRPASTRQKMSVAVIMSSQCQVSVKSMQLWYESAVPPPGVSHQAMPQAPGSHANSAAVWSAGEDLNPLSPTTKVTPLAQYCTKAQHSKQCQTAGQGGAHWHLKPRTPLQQWGQSQHRLGNASQQQTHGPPAAADAAAANT